MRVVFMGTPQFAVPALRALAVNHEVVSVYTRPDSASGRGSILRPSAVKTAAQELGIPTVQPTTLADQASVDALRNFRPDLVVVAAYGLILPADALTAAPNGGINVHASLLPRWRGAAPIQRAILAGDERTGVSIMRVEAGLDTGPYCCQQALDIDEMSTEELSGKLAALGAAAMLDAIRQMAAGIAEWTVQDESLVTYAQKITRADVAVTPGMTTAEFARRVRASSRAAPCRIRVAGRGVTLLKVHPEPTPITPGGISVADGSLLLGMEDGAVEVDELKQDGKGTMPGASWVRGARDVIGSSWSGSV